MNIDVLIEFLPLIETCNVYFTNIKPEKFENFIIEENEIKIQEARQQTLLTISSKGISFKPDSLSGFQSGNDWISFRVQTNTKARLISSIIEGLTTEIGLIELENDLISLESITNASTICQCSSCCNAVTGELSIKRIRALPSVDWDSASEGWFCHLHDQHKKSLKESELVPKLEDCFYNELYYVLNRANILSTSNNDIIKCLKCFNSLGYIKGKTGHLWTDCVNWASNDEVLISRAPKDIILNLISNLEKDSFGINSRIVLQKNCSPKQFLFISVMDPNLTLLVNKRLNFEESHKNSPCESFYNKRIKMTGEPSLELKRVKSVKAIFKIKEGEDNESGAWFDDINVHILPCSDHFFETIYSQLQSTSRYFTNFLDNDMKVGFLMR